MSCPEVPGEPTKSKYTEKGCIHWFDPDSPYEYISSQKARPFIIVGRNNFKSPRVIISPLQDNKNYTEKGKLKYPFHTSLYKKHYDFLDKDSVILLDQVYTIPKRELWAEWYMGKVDDLRKIDLALFYNFDLYDTITYMTGKMVGAMEDWHINRHSRR